MCDIKARQLFNEPNHRTPMLADRSPIAHAARHQLLDSREPLMSRVLPVQFFEMKSMAEAYFVFSKRRCISLDIDAIT
ncbi:DEAD-like helicase, N-terminal domain containing protein [Dorcoceras hygrometricum]|uniref:DEAD-like helicase, N-terminal domain containing protein n=1 Tax=Dorcoceras hygrometricum TaxID=472368 RepID=A0A2Z6ZQW6_9LAMI|nr:DEAD-like helicase, N-terminal domain containing protein [Dorcoceras hygrometricum]